MKKLIALFIVAILTGLGSVSAEYNETGTSATDSGSDTEMSTTSNDEDMDENDDEDEDMDENDDEDEDMDENDDEDEDMDENDDEDEDMDERKGEKRDFMNKFNNLKKEYKNKMGNEEDRKEYFEKRKELFEEYKNKLGNKDKRVKNMKKKAMNLGANMKLKREEVKAKYKKTYTKKYGKLINRLSDDKVQILIDKIDELIGKVENSKRPEEQKDKLLGMLDGLRSVAEEKLNPKKTNEGIIDSLFNLN